MPEDHNDSLEQFFRKGLRGGEFAFRESDWEGLEKRLDDADAAFRAGFRRGAGLISILLLIVSGLLVYTLLTGGQTEPSQEISGSPDNMGANEINSPILAEKESISKPESEPPKASESLQENLSARDTYSPNSGDRGSVEETGNEGKTGQTTSAQNLDEGLDITSSNNRNESFGDGISTQVESEDNMPESTTPKRASSGPTE